MLKSTNLFYIDINVHILVKLHVITATQAHVPFFFCKTPTFYSERIQPTKITFNKLHVIFMFILSFIFCDSFISFLRGSNSVHFFIYLFVNICNVVGDLVIKSGSLDWVTGFYPPYLCARPKPWFPTEYFVVICLSSMLYYAIDWVMLDVHPAEFQILE